MKAIVDTSSWINFVRYYLPLDKSGALLNFIKTKFDSGELLIIDKVFEELTYISGGIAINELSFLEKKSSHIKTGNILPDKTFYNLLNNQFLDKNAIKIKALEPLEVESAKSTYLENADCKQILFAKSIIHDYPLIVTEETINSNDGKPIRKIPYNCGFLKIDCCTLPLLLSNHFGLSFSFLNTLH